MTRSAQETARMIPHLEYEIQMFQWTAEQLSWHETNSVPARNAFLESFTINARALLQFFFYFGAEVDDLLAANYFDDPLAWSKIRGKRASAFDPVPTRVGFEIAHLSCKRLGVEPEAKDWDIKAIHAAMMHLV